MDDVTTMVPGADAAAGGAGAGGEAGGTVETELETPAPGDAGGEGAAPGDAEPGDGSEGAGEGDQGGKTQEELDAELDQELGLERDGRKVEGKMRSALAKLKQVDKEAAKLVADTYFREQRYMQEAGAKTPHEAIKNVREMRASLEALGGEEGINTMQEKIETFDRESEQLANSDPELFRQLIESDPEAMGKNAAITLELIAQKDINQFESAIQSAFVLRMERAQFPQTVDYLMGLVKEGKGQEAFDTLNQMKDWWGKLTADNKKRIEARSQVDPRQQALDRQRQEVERDKDQLYSTRIEEKLNTLNNREISRHVEPFFKQFKLPIEGKRRFIGSVQSDVWAAMKKDRAFQRQFKAIRARGDVTASAEFVHQKFAEYLPEVFRRVRNEMYPAYKQKPTAKPGGTAAAPGAKPGANNGAGTQRVNVQAGKKPSHDAVDWTKTSDTMWIAGKAYLKDGKLYAWKWADN